MSNFHRRIIDLSWFDDKLPTFETDEQAQAWYAALGRLVAYGLHSREGRDSVDVVVLGILDGQEMVAAYSPTLPLRGEPDASGYAPYVGSLDQQLDDTSNAIQGLIPGRRFVLGAVFHEYNQKWGFHS